MATNPLLSIFFNTVCDEFSFLTNQYGFTVQRESDVVIYFNKPAWRIAVWLEPYSFEVGCNVAHIDRLEVRELNYQELQELPLSPVYMPKTEGQLVICLRAISKILKTRSEILNGNFKAFEKIYVRVQWERLRASTAVMRARAKKARQEKNWELVEKYYEACENALNALEKEHLAFARKMQRLKQ